MPTSLKEIIRCPVCQGPEVVYSCEPKCCFNHVCADCRTTFLINTEKTGRFDHSVALDAADPDSTDPTTGCANCESLKVTVLSSDAAETLLICARCHAISRLLIEDVVKGF